MADKKKKKKTDEKPGKTSGKASDKKEVDKKEKDKKEKELPPLPGNLTEEQLIEYKEAFDLFNESDEPKIPVISVVTLMRKLGLMPSDKDVQDIIEEMDTDGSLAYDGLAYEHFCCVAAKKIDEVYGEDDIIASFKMFDPTSSGIIHLNELKRIMQQMGDPLTEEEMDAMIDCVQPDSQGNVKYGHFVREMMNEF